MKRKILIALGLLALVATPALAALWPAFPIVGSSAFCSSTNQAGVPGTTPVCTTGTPAGPAIVSGLETIPADTNRAGGVQPQTVKLTLASLNALPVSFVDVTNQTTFTAGATTGGFFLVSSGALTSATINLPTSPIDGQQFAVSANNNITSLTVSGTPATVSNAPTEMTTSTTASYGYVFRYRATDTTWYRIQ